MIRRPFHSLTAAVSCAVLLGACAKGERASNQPADSTARNLTLAPSESSGAMRDVPVPNKEPATRPPVKPPTRPAPPATVTVASGTHLDIAVTDTITSRRNHPGDASTARIVYDEPRARVAGIPDGAALSGPLVDLKPAPHPPTPRPLTLALSPPPTPLPS